MKKGRVLMKRKIGVVLVCAMLFSVFSGSSFSFAENEVPSVNEDVLLYADMDAFTGGRYANGTTTVVDSENEKYGKVAQLGEEITRFQDNVGFDLSRAGITSISFDLYRSAADAGTVVLQYNKQAAGTPLASENVYSILGGQEFFGTAWTADSAGAEAVEGWRHYEIVAYAAAHKTDDAAHGSTWTETSKLCLYVDGQLVKETKFAIPRVPRGFKLEFSNTAEGTTVYMDNLMIAYNNLESFSTVVNSGSAYTDVIFSESVEEFDTAMTTETVSVTAPGADIQPVVESVEKINSQLLRIHYSAPLASGAEYVVNLGGSLTSVCGNTLTETPIGFTAPVTGAVGVKSVRLADETGKESEIASTVPSTIKTIKMTFYGEVTKESLDQAVSLQDDSGVVTAETAFADGVYTITPEDGFIPGVNYVLAAYGYSQNFSVEMARAIVGGVEVRDADGAVDPAVCDPAAIQTIAVKFDSEMDPDTLQSAVRLYLAGTEVLTTAAYDLESKTMLLTLKEALVNDKLYTVCVDETAADTTGNTLGETFVYQFRTAATVSDSLFEAFTDIDASSEGIEQVQWQLEFSDSAHGNSLPPKSKNPTSAVSYRAYDTARSGEMFLSFDVYRTEGHTGTLYVFHRKSNLTTLQALYTIDGTTQKEGFPDAAGALSGNTIDVRDGWTHYDIKTSISSAGSTREVYINGELAASDSYALPSNPGGFKIELVADANTADSKLLVDNVSATYIGTEEFAVQARPAADYVDLYFSEPIANTAEKLHAGTVTLREMGGSPAAAKVEVINNQVVRVAPTEGMQPGREYAVTVSDEVLSVMGNILASGECCFNAPGESGNVLRRVRLINYKADELLPADAMPAEIGQIQILVGGETTKAELDSDIEFKQSDGTEVSYTTMYNAATGLYTLDFGGYLKPETQYTLTGDQYGYAYTFTTNPGTVIVTKLVLLEDGGSVDIADIQDGDSLTLRATILNTSGADSGYLVSYATYNDLQMSGFDYQEGTLANGGEVTVDLHFTVQSTAGLSINGFVWDGFDSLKPYIENLVVA